MKSVPPEMPVKRSLAWSGRWLLVLLPAALFVWSLPRPRWHDVVVNSSDESPRARIVFRTSERLEELAAHGPLADETELSGPAFADGDQTLYFSRSRPGQRADIVRSTWDGERWSRPQAVQELNSVDDDRRLTLSSDGQTAALASNRSGGRGGFDLYEVRVGQLGRWSQPRNAGSAINTEANEFDPALAPDGLTLYFVRMQPNGNSDIFVTRREQVDSAWSQPRPIETINLPQSHERSPSVSPDGRFLLFASNRGQKGREPTTFHLFRAALHDGSVGAVEEITDGIGSAFDDIDAAFSADGRSLVFVSKRDGPKQLYLSRGEFVVKRLALSAVHLDRFGRLKWCIPFATAMLCGIAYRWSRRRQRYKVTTRSEPVSSSNDRVRQIAPAKNPLAHWVTASPVEDVQRRSTKVTSTDRINTDLPSSQTPAVAVRQEHRLRRFAAIVTVAVVIAALILSGPSRIWKGIPQTPTEAINSQEYSLANSTFAEVTAPKTVELAQLARADTSRMEVPRPIPLPSGTIPLRPAARWPGDRVVVRQQFPLSRPVTSEPKQTSANRSLLTGRKTTGLATRSIAEIRGEEVKFSQLSLFVEKAFPQVTLSLARESSAVSAPSILPRPASQFQNALRPSPIRTAILSESAQRNSELTIRPMALLARRPITGDAVKPADSPPVEALLGSLEAPERPTSPQPIKLLRNDEGLNVQTTVASSMSKTSTALPRRNALAIAEFSVERTMAAVVPAMKRLSSSAGIKPIPLPEEVALPAMNMSSAEALVPPPDAKLTRSSMDTPHRQFIPRPLDSNGSVPSRVAIRIELATNFAVEGQSQVIPASASVVRRSTQSDRIRKSPVEVPTETAVISQEVPLAAASVAIDVAASSAVKAVPRVEVSGSAQPIADPLGRNLIGFQPRAKRVLLEAMAAGNDFKLALAATKLSRKMRVIAPVELAEGP